MNATPAIPITSDAAPVACPDWIYTTRHVVEGLWAKLTEWRTIAMRYDTVQTFMGVLCLAATLD